MSILKSKGYFLRTSGLRQRGVPNFETIKLSFPAIVQDIPKSPILI
jgi:hypothetical protein